MATAGRCAGAPPRARSTSDGSQTRNIRPARLAYLRVAVFSLAECLVGLIGLMALDDVLEGRPARRTWGSALAVIGTLAALMAAAIGAGSLLS